MSRGEHPSRRQTSSRDRGQGPGASEISMREGRGRDCQRRRDGLLLEDAHLPEPGRTAVAKCDTSFVRTAAGDSSKSIDRAVKPATRHEGVEKQATHYAIHSYLYYVLFERLARGRPTTVVYVVVNLGRMLSA